MASQTCLKALEWAAKRMAMTTSLGMVLLPSGPILPNGAGNPLLNAFSGLACLRALRLFVYRASLDGHGVYEEFSDWILEHAVSLEACDLSTGHSPRLAAGTMMSQHLKHLDISAASFKGGKCQAAKQLPVLETLCINGHGDGRELGVLDLSECLHLRELAMKGVIVHQLLMNRGCVLSYNPAGLLRSLGNPLSGPVGGLLASAGRVALNTEDDLSLLLGGPHGIFGSLSCTQELRLFWPGWRIQSGVHPDPVWKLLLTTCMPRYEKPFCSLRSLVIRASDMMGHIPGPGKLPHLEELVIRGHTLQLSFEDPDGTFSALRTFYASGHSVELEGLDTVRSALGVLTGRGMALSEVSVSEAGMHPQKGSHCVYLHPINGHQWSMRECLAIVERLTRCRCGTCFPCLGAAGRIDLLQY